MISAESVKAKLKNHAQKSGHILQDELTLYGLERTIYRISISEHANKFTLKGGIFLYALFEGEFARATTDIDFLAKGINNEVEGMHEIFTDIFSLEVDDALRFALDTLEVHTITEFKEYAGVHVSIKAFLDKTRIPVSIDIGFGDVIYPDRVIMEFPVLLNMDVPKIYAYSISSVIAEKFEAIVSLGYGNSRYKDFYDIYILATKYRFSGIELQQAIIKTFKHRGTELEDIVAFEPDFINETLRQKRWDAFIKKKKAMIQVGLVEAIAVMKVFLIPVVDSIRNDTAYEKDWNNNAMKWE